ncbi:MAG: hypothetical protein HYY63_04830 [Elusimicrobia bacterium]|nr:hypothetical protein [Elusimicrobiota bacterium]
MMKKKKASPPVTRLEFLKETGLIRSEFKQECASIRSEFKQECASIRSEFKQEKEWVRDTIGKLTLRIIRLEEELKSMREQMATKDDVRRILDAIDAFTHRVETYDRKAVVHDARLNQNELTLQNHETRIVQIETSLPKQSY